jgi:hypothetical protein
VSRSPVVRLLVAAVGVGAAAAAARRLRGPAAPVFLAPPTAPAGLLRTEPALPVAVPAPAHEPNPEPATVEPDAPEPDAPEPATERRPAPPGERWVFPLDDGTCPPGHPIKAKLRSGLYHQPGMAAYGRTHPDRCYAEAVDAEADGLRRAKH